MSKQTKKQFEQKNSVPRFFSPHEKEELKKRDEILMRFATSYNAEGLSKMEKAYLDSIAGGDKDIALGRCVKALETIAITATQHKKDADQFKAIFIAYLNSPLSGLAIANLGGELGEHAIKLRNEIHSILNS